MARIPVHVCCGVDLMEVFPKILTEVVAKDIRMKELVEIRIVDIRSAKNLQDLNGSEIIIGDVDGIVGCLPHCNKAKWIHSIYAGIETIIECIRKLKLQPAFTLTRCGGVMGSWMAEYVTGYVLALEKGFFTMREDQKSSKWRHYDYSFDQTPLSKVTMGILGAGDIGLCIAKMCKNIGMRTWGLVRQEPTLKSPYIDNYRTTSNLKELLRECNYICNVLPSTPETIDLLSGNVLECCKEKSPVFINVGRGDVIQEDTIVEAISQRWISKAVLDVFQTEPLPADSPLWGMSEVFITPHMSGLTPLREASEKFLETLKLYLEGKPLPYVVDLKHGY